MSMIEYNKFLSVRWFHDFTLSTSIMSASRNRNKNGAWECVPGCWWWISPVVEVSSAVTRDCLSWRRDARGCRGAEVLIKVPRQKYWWSSCIEVRIGVPVHIFWIVSPGEILNDIQAQRFWTLFEDMFRNGVPGKRFWMLLLERGYELYPGDEVLIGVPRPEFLNATSRQWLPMGSWGTGSEWRPPMSQFPATLSLVPAIFYTNGVSQRFRPRTMIPLNHFSL